MCMSYCPGSYLFESSKAKIQTQNTTESSDINEYIYGQLTRVLKPFNRGNNLFLKKNDAGTNRYPHAKESSYSSTSHHT